ncbi:MAG: hypothetical protein IJZ50_06645 [Alistipes sp.]|nr:hypothetical protein [Alistipes sp.]
MGKNFRMLLLPLLALVALVGCDKPDQPTPAPEVGFTVEIDEVTAYELTFTIAPPSASPTYTVKLYPDNKSLDKSDIELAAEIVGAEDFTTYEGKQTLTFGGLVGNSAYRLVYFAYDVEAGKLLSDLYRSDVITTPESEDAFEISVSDITGISAKVSITPPDNELTYFYFIEEKADYENYFGGDDQSLIYNDFAYWEFMASMYEGVTWLDLLAMELSQGVQSFSSDDLFGSLEWDTDYFVYAYGLNTEGEVTQSMTKKFFKTNAPEASDNTFEVEMGDVVWDSEKMGFVAHATVTPKNLDESYYAVITNKDWYDWYFTEDNKGRSDNKYIMYQLILNCPSSVIALEECKVGVSDISNEDWQTGLRPEREYAVFVFGFGADGATTDLQVFPFTTPARPQE